MQQMKRFIDRQREGEREIKKKKERWRDIKRQREIAREKIDGYRERQRGRD